MNGSADGRKNHVTVMIDDASLLDVAADGASNHVTDFVHYCHTLTSDYVRTFLCDSVRRIFLAI